MEMTKWGVFLIEAQPIHNWDLEQLFHLALCDCDKLVVAIGSASADPRKPDPLDMDLRVKLAVGSVANSMPLDMLKQFVFLKMPCLTTGDDIEQEDFAKWAEALYEGVTAATKSPDFTFYTTESRVGKITPRFAKLKEHVSVEAMPFVDDLPEWLQGEYLRERIIAGDRRFIEDNCDREISRKFDEIREALLSAPGA